jgi:FkbM family methyltransferase
MFTRGWASWFAKDVRTVIDVGAGIGGFTYEALKLFPEANVYAFEPHPESIQQLNRLSRETPETAKRITVFNLALGEVTETKDLLCLPRATASSLLEVTELSGKLFPGTSGSKPIKVQVKRLDEVVIGLKSKVLIKMDAQGFEDRIVLGGMGVFSKADYVVTEVCLLPLYEGQASFHVLTSILDTLGFSYAGNVDQVRLKNSRIAYVDALFVRVSAIVNPPVTCA